MDEKDRPKERARNGVRLFEPMPRALPVDLDLINALRDGDDLKRYRRSMVCAGRAWASGAGLGTRTTNREPCD